MAALVLHINREALHHGAEIALLLDLYTHRQEATVVSPPAFQIAVDAADPHRLNRFWAAAVGYEMEDHHDQINAADRCRPCVGR